MGVQDIRLHLSFRDHLKRMKLQGRLGAAGVLGFIDLLMGVAHSRPDGVLTGYSKEDIAIISKYLQDCDEFVDTLVAVGLLDVDESKTYAIHDWADYQIWAVTASDRADRGRMAALRRWNPEMAAELESQGVSTISAKDCSDMFSGYEKKQKKSMGDPLGDPMPNDGNPNAKPWQPQCSHTHTHTHIKDSVSKKTTRKKQGHDPKNDPEFLEFWYRCPRKVKKPEAVKAWAKLNGDRPELSVILSALERQKASPEWQREGGRYIPHPATWLNGRRWEDEIQGCVSDLQTKPDYSRPDDWADPSWLLELDDQQKGASEGQVLRGDMAMEPVEREGAQDEIKI